MDEVLINALALIEPATFLREGDHDFDDIFETGAHQRPVPELSTPAGVN